MKGAIMEYLTTELQEKRFVELTELDNTPKGDLERWSLFFIIAGNNELWNLREQIYNFKERCIEPDILETGICTSSKQLIKLSFNLFNSYPMDSVIDTFSSLDSENFELGMKAIRIRLNR